MRGIIYNERELETACRISSQAAHDLCMVTIKSLETVILDQEATIHALTGMLERVMVKKWGELPPCIKGCDDK